MPQFIFEKFLNEFKNEFCALLNSTITSHANHKNDQDLYFVKRETLKLIMVLLENDESFTSFKSFYVNNVDNLKIIMGLLNHSCLRIKEKALDILYHFFVDLESRDRKIQCILFKNKGNFEKYFLINLESTDEKKNFILFFIYN